MIFDVLNKILPVGVSSALKRVNFDMLYEIRVRSMRPISVGYGDGYYYLSDSGVTKLSDNAVTVSREEIFGIMERACDKSLYAVNDKIRQGYLTLQGGVRIGIAGETVFDDGRLITVKNFTALNIRIPHEVIGCSDKILPHLKNYENCYSTLIVSPPGAGKTTLLRDLSRNLGSDRRITNVLVVDERNEIAATNAGIPSLDVGKNADVIVGCNKNYAFNLAVRALRPDIIVTDELCGEDDVAAVEGAITGGVCVFASVHAPNLKYLAEKQIYRRAIENKLFTRYVVLSSKRGPGSVEGIYDENFDRLGGER